MDVGNFKDSRDIIYAAEKNSISTHIFCRAFEYCNTHHQYEEQEQKVKIL